MSRVINRQGPGKIRNRERRTIAELLRHLMAKRELDSEARDMAAALVFSLEKIADSVEQTTEAWEKRNYYLKADRFRLEWEWTRPMAKRLREIILHGDWHRLPYLLAELAPRFADIRVTRMTRQPITWKAAYTLLLAQDTQETT